jgi:hypothetical protein
MDELGLLVRLLSRPDGWEVRPEALCRETGWGRDRLRRVLQNLEKCGYLQRQRQRDHKKGQWNWTSEIYAEAQDVDFHHRRVSRTMADPSTGQPSNGKPVDIEITEDIHYRFKTSPSSSEKDDDGEKDREDYLDLAIRYGNINDPTGFRITKRKEWDRQGGLSARDSQQLADRRRRRDQEQENSPPGPGQVRQVSNDTATLAGFAAAFGENGNKNKELGYE